MNSNDFKLLYLCECHPYQRDSDLLKKISEYYDATPDSIDNKSASILWKRFRDWAKDGGYTHDEIVRTKKLYWSMQS